MDDPEGGLQLVCDEKHPFFLRLLARDIVFAESFRYFALHGDATKPAAAASVNAGFVPFTWESSPGTPKQDYVRDHHHHHHQGPICPSRPLTPPPARITNHIRSFNHHRHHSSVCVASPHSPYSSPIGRPRPPSPTSSIFASAPIHNCQCSYGYLHAADGVSITTASVRNRSLASRLKKLLLRRRRFRCQCQCLGSLACDSPHAKSFASSSPLHWRMLSQRTEHDQFVMRGDGTYLISPSRSRINDKTSWPEYQSIKISNGVADHYTTDNRSPARSSVDNDFFSFTDQSTYSLISNPSAAADQNAGRNPQMLRQMFEEEQPLSPTRIQVTSLLVEDQQQSLPPAKKTTSCLPEINAKRRYSTKREHSTCSRARAKYRCLLLKLNFFRLQ